MDFIGILYDPIQTENYAPEWTRGVPVRRIASAGSLASCKSQTKLR